MLNLTCMCACDMHASRAVSR